MLLYICSSITYTIYVLEKKYDIYDKGFTEHHGLAEETAQQRLHLCDRNFGLGTIIRIESLLISPSKASCTLDVFSAAHRGAWYVFFLPLNAPAL